MTETELRTLVWINQEYRRKYWASRSSAHTAHSFACSALLASLARSLCSLPRLWKSELLMSLNDLVLPHSAAVTKNDVNGNTETLPSRSSFNARDHVIHSPTKLPSSYQITPHNSSRVTTTTTTRSPQSSSANVSSTLPSHSTTRSPFASSSPTSPMSNEELLRQLKQRQKHRLSLQQQQSSLTQPHLPQQQPSFLPQRRESWTGNGFSAPVEDGPASFAPAGVQNLRLKFENIQVASG